MLRATIFTPKSFNFSCFQKAGFKWVPPQTTGHSTNYHRSNRAKEGLFHGKDIRFGHTISHSFVHAKRCWKPNVQSKKLFSLALNKWVKFNATTTAIKAVDNYGGIDNYLLKLDDRLVESSNFLLKTRYEIAAALFHKSELSEQYIKKFGFDFYAPPKPESESVEQKEN